VVCRQRHAHRRRYPQACRQQLHITVSAGVAPNKFLAKIASDWRKPNGLFVITPDQVRLSSPRCRSLVCTGWVRSRRTSCRGWA
jgi:hypothetical protein